MAWGMTWPCGGELYIQAPESENVEYNREKSQGISAQHARHRHKNAMSPEVS